jgi:hypothetical protein
MGPDIYNDAIAGFLNVQHVGETMADLTSGVELREPFRET